MARPLALAATVAATDLGAKWLAERRLDTPISLLPGLHLKLGHNSGIAFGALDGVPSAVLVAAAACLVLALLAAIISRWQTLPWPPVGLLLGGATGNLLDRLADGRVTDFIELPRWPTFNLADIAITCAVLLLLWRVAREPRPHTASV